MSAKMYKISDSNPIVSELDYDEYMENKSTYDSDDNAYVVTDAPAEDGMEADDIFYDNSTSGLSNRNVQGAIDSVNGKVTVLQTQNGSETLTTTAQTLSGAVNEIKSSLTNYATVNNLYYWKPLQMSATSSVSVASISGGFKEIQVFARFAKDGSQTYCTSTVISKDEIPSGSSGHTYRVFSGSHFTSSNGIGTRIDLYQGTVTLGAFYVDGTNYTFSSGKVYMDVFYR